MFKNGQSLNRYPVRLIYTAANEELKFQAQALFVVPKKLFRKAHERNLLRRRRREAYRLHKHELYQKLKDDKKLLAFVYTSKKEENYREIEKSIVSILAAMLKKNTA